MKLVIALLILSSNIYAQDLDLLNLALKATVEDIQDQVNDHEARLLKLEAGTPVIAKAVATNYDSWVRSNYAPPKGSLRAYNNSFKNGMMANESIHLVWQHLNEHGFQNINHLEQWVALALHDAAHGNRISPGNKTVAAKTKTKAAAYGNCANGQCARPSFFTRRQVRRSRR